jgi:hypothetical protein
MALPFYIKKYLKAKRRIMELKYLFHHAKIYLIFFKKSSKRNQNPSRYYYNSIITNLKFQHECKMSSFKNAHIQVDPLLLLLPGRGQNPLSYYILYNESKHNILAKLGRQGQQTNPC